MLDSFVTEAERAAAAGGPDWLSAERRAAIARFDRLGFPTTREEDWRFFNVAPIAEGRFALAGREEVSGAAPAVEKLQWAGSRAATLVFLNGSFDAALSDAARLPHGVRAGSLGRELSAGNERLRALLTRVANDERRGFTALNTAFLRDGAYIEIPDGVAVADPIHVVFLSAGGAATMTHPRVLAAAGANSQATIVESYGALRDAPYFTNAVVEIAAGPNATLHHYKVQREAVSASHVAAIHIKAAKDATVATHSISFGGALVRNDVTVVLDGEGAAATLNGLYVLDGERLVDNHTTIVHAKPHCASRELYKGIVAERGRAVFNGKIVVRPDAQKTDSKQTSKALLLSEEAHINTNPQLEIFANDVKCTHGAAVGQMDDDAIFYLRSRGLGAREARHLLVRAFAADVLNQMPLEALRVRLEQDLIARLPEARS